MHGYKMSCRFKVKAIIVMILVRYFAKSFSVLDFNNSNYRTILKIGCNYSINWRVIEVDFSPVNSAIFKAI